MSGCLQGPGPSQGTLSEAVVEVKLVDGLGRLRTITQGDPELAAIRACLGMCGVLVEISLQVLNTMFCYNNW